MPNCCQLQAIGCGVAANNIARGTNPGDVLVYLPPPTPQLFFLASQGSDSGPKKRLHVYYHYVVFPNRQYAACASTLITQKHSPKEENQGIPKRKENLCSKIYFLSVPTSDLTSIYILQLPSLLLPSHYMLRSTFLLLKS